MKTQGLRINVGCGQTPTAGWQNYDGSPSVRLAKVPLLARAMYALGFIDEPQWNFISFARRSTIRYADATRRIPVESGAIEVLYSSHMIEHLGREDAKRFLNEAKRVLCSGGMIRLAVPDLRRQVDRYLSTGDADLFMQGTNLYLELPRGLVKRVIYLFSGARRHLWMYDGPSLSRLLVAQGFVNPCVVPAGQTGIVSPKPLNLREREEESIYVEAKRP